MNDTPLFTVVLSGYQTEPYLQKALDSVADQTFRDFEAICYVEESTDRSLEICRAMADRDPRFKVATGPKSGAVATTRNYGIDHASGQYLAALDGDDWLAPDMLEKLAEKLKQTGPVDVLSFAAVTTESDDVDWETAGGISNFKPADERDVFTGLEAIRRTGRNGGSIHNYTPLSIYRTEFLREHRLYQSDGLRMEDFEWTPRVWFFAQRFAYLDRKFYAYRRRSGSLTTEVSPRILFDLAKQFRSLAAFAADHEIPGDVLAIWSNQWISVLIWFMFHPVTSRKFTDTDRTGALRTIFEGEGRERFLRILSRTSRPKRLAKPLFLLAANGHPLLARLYFRRLYFPMIGRRGRGKK